MNENILCISHLIVTGCHWKWLKSTLCMAIKKLHRYLLWVNIISTLTTWDNNSHCVPTDTNE